MNKIFMKSLLLTAGSVLAVPVAFANTNWVGTANYLAAPGAESDEALVGPFDTYDFGAGIGLVKPDTTVAPGNSFTGYFQTVVNGHFLNSVGINVGQLDVSGGDNFAGTGDGFELTVTSQFTGVYTGVSADALNFSITGGTANLYFDSNPNYSFANDSGFGDGTPIFTGTITGGVGSIFSPFVVGVGFEQISLDIGSFDSNVYSPDTINGGSAQFLVKVGTSISNTPIINEVAGGVNSVGGVSAVGGQLIELDGQMQLTAVPLPTAAWLFLTGFMGFLSLARKSRRDG